MKNIIYSILFLLVSLTSYSQNNFPKSWTGNYEGELQIYAVDSVGIRLKMKLKIQPTTIDSLYHWTIVYDFKGKEDIRAYELKVIDTAKGHYQINEKNSIIIEAYYKNEVFTSFFKVMDSFIVATYTKNKNDEIVFEIISSNALITTTTGGKKIDNEAIPEVTSYQVSGRQQAILHKTD